MNRSLLVKVLALVALLMALAVMASMVQGVVQGRLGYRAQAWASVEQGWAGPQVVAGPWLERVCEQRWIETSTNQKVGVVRTEVTDTVTQRHIAQTLESHAKLSVTPRERGIFTVQTYLTQGTATAVFEPWVQPDAGKRANFSQSCQIRLAFALSDRKGMQQAALSVNGQPVVLGAAGAGAGSEVLTAPIDAASALAGVSLQLTLSIAGARQLTWLPSAESHSQRVSGDWAHVSYGGQHLPQKRTQTGNSFDAQWLVTSFASATPAQLRDGSIKNIACAVMPQSEKFEGDHTSSETSAETTSGFRDCNGGFGLRLIDPVDHYTLGDRATKYAMLFVVLTFAFVLLFEVLKSLRVHAIQYGLVGSALVMFFLLLVSLSEHLGFARAYLTAATACTLLLTLYAQAVLGGWVRAAAFGLGVAVLYGVLYALLQLESMALLLGSGLLFAALAAIMLSTRRIDWHEFGRSAKGTVQERASVQEMPRANLSGNESS